MSDKDKKLTPEKLQQIKQLQQLMMMQQNGAGAQGHPGAPKAPHKYSVKGMFIAMLKQMQNCVKFVDMFIDFVTKPNSEKTNDVIKNARAPILFGTFVLICFVFVGVSWSALAPLDSATVAIGTVISNSHKKTINHQEGGIIKDIYIKVGDLVKKDDKLIEFDDTRVKSQYENTLNQYRSYAAAESRLLAEVNYDKEITYPKFLLDDIQLPAVAKIIETQDNLFRSKNSLLAAEKESAKQIIEQSKKQIEGYIAKKTALQKTLEVTQDRLNAAKKLEEQGYAHKATILEIETKEANAKSELAIMDTEIAKTEQTITKTEIELVNLDNKSSTHSLSELRETQMKLAETQETLFALTDSLKRIIIRSPVDGIVNSLNYHTIGSTIPNNGQSTIMEISPADDKLVIEAKIAPQNIDSIQAGLNSKIKFSAFKSRTSPLFQGTVISLSPDIIIDPQAAQMDPKLGGGYYLALIELDMENFNELAAPRKLKLQPGMQAEVQIITGTRTLLRYLLDPVIDAMFKGFKEK